MDDCIDHGCKGFGLGYATAWIKTERGRVTTTKHRAVYYEATGMLPEVVEHICNNPRCININHLKAGTHKSNAAYKVKCGRANVPSMFGTANPNCKLSDADVAFIREHYVKGSKEWGLPSLARMFGCGTSQVHRIVKGARSVQKV
jgi:hypothetical protein